MRQLAATLVLLLAVVASAVAVVRMHHERRHLFVELERLDSHRDRLQVEWGKLQLEQSTWAAQDRIERIAVERLDLHVPRADATVLVATGKDE